MTLCAPICQRLLHSAGVNFVRRVKACACHRSLSTAHARLDVVDETWTEDCVLHVPGFEIAPGRAGQKNVGRAIFAAFGDVHVEVLDTIVEGDRVVERHRATAVHKGDFMGIPATGRKVYWTESH